MRSVREARGEGVQVTQAHYAFLAALVVTALLTPLCRRLAVGTGALAQPTSRSVHTRPMPYLGGLAIAGGFILALLAVPQPELAKLPLIVGGIFVLALGVLDDLKELRPKLKLLGQLAAALVLVLGGVRISHLTNPLGDMFTLGYLSVPFTVIWVVGLMNVVNLSDGLDGLAAGISTIASLTLLFVALQQGQAHMVVATAALAGSTLGFLPFNFSPARIFMGDAGSMFLGYALAALSIQGTLKSATAFALIIPILALGLPMFDAFFAVLRRASNGRPIYQADRGHLHHRLLQLGMSQRQVVLLMYAVSATLGLAATLVTTFDLRQGGIMLLAIGGGGWLAGKKAGVLELGKETDRQRSA